MIIFLPFHFVIMDTLITYLYQTHSYIITLHVESTLASFLYLRARHRAASAENFVSICHMCTRAHTEAMKAEY